MSEISKFIVNVFLYLFKIPKHFSKCKVLVIVINYVLTDLTTVAMAKRMKRLKQRVKSRPMAMEKLVSLCLQLCEMLE